eukprot:8747896-Pyramimonas_sp.AAC.1
MVQHSRGTAQSWYNTVVVQYSRGTVQSWYSTVAVQHSHGLFSFSWPRDRFPDQRVSHLDRAVVSERDLGV